jgi:vacuolar-type H+-ATPase subunit E/Vma4
MANDKLQDLITALKRQGVESGEEAARRVVEDAEKKAAEIKAQAEAEARAIVAKAQAEADQRMARLQSSMEIAASQFVGSLKRVLEKELLVIPLQKELAKELGGAEFLKKLMEKFVEAYAKNPGREQIKLVLPAGAQNDLHTYASDLMARHFGTASGVIAAQLETGGVKFGFQVDKSSGNVRLDFSDEAFLALFLNYLAPRFRGLFKPVKTEEAARK